MDLKYLSFYIFAISSIMSCFCKEGSVATRISYNKPTHSKIDSYNKNKRSISSVIQTTDSTFTVVPNKDNDLLTTTIPYRKDTTISSIDTDYLQTTSKEDTTTTTTTTTASVKIMVNSSRDVSCTCGIFLSSQFIKGSSDQPKGEPVITNLLDIPLPCSSIGKKQCQTKCLEQIVKHLPNSANILCATLDRDIHKEKAFLFIRNCNKKWHNTNLSANREYCCKNGLPYNCRKKFYI